MMTNTNLAIAMLRTQISEQGAIDQFCSRFDINTVNGVGIKDWRKDDVGL